MPHRKGYRPPELDDDDRDLPEPTAQPRDRPAYAEEDGDRLVPLENVGGAAPSIYGADSGGDLPGPVDDLSSLAEPEPPESPEVSAVHIRYGEGGPKSPRR